MEEVGCGVICVVLAVGLTVGVMKGCEHAKKLDAVAVAKAEKKGWFTKTPKESPPPATSAVTQCRSPSSSGRTT